MSERYLQPQHPSLLRVLVAPVVARRGLQVRVPDPTRDCRQVDAVVEEMHVGSLPRHWEVAR